jgi:hypothetical protein
MINQRAGSRDSPVFLRQRRTHGLASLAFFWQQSGSHRLASLAWLWQAWAQHRKSCGFFARSVISARLASYCADGRWEEKNHRAMLPSLARFSKQEFASLASFCADGWLAGNKFIVRVSFVFCDKGRPTMLASLAAFGFRKPRL